MQTLHDAELERFGMWALGPILYGFSRWLTSAEVQLIAEPHFLFVSRDSEILHRAFLAQNPEGASSHWPLGRALASRLALANADVQAHVVSGNFAGTLGSFAEGRLGLLPEEFTGLDIPVQAATWISLPRDRDFVLQQVMSWAPRLQEMDGMLVEHLSTTLSQYESGGHTVVFCDVGYSGTIQGCLERLFGIERPGRYVMATPTGFALGRRAGWLRAHHEWGQDAVLDNSLVLESLMQAPYGAVLSMVLASNRSAHIHGERGLAQEQARHLKSLQEGALVWQREMIAADLDASVAFALADEAARLLTGPIRPMADRLMWAFETDDPYSGGGTE